jgi:hypothetical protein
MKASLWKAVTELPVLFLNIVDCWNCNTITMTLSTITLEAHHQHYLHLSVITYFNIICQLDQFDQSFLLPHFG